MQFMQGKAKTNPQKRDMEEEEMIHQLKCEKKFFEDVASGKKKFEVRNNDRFFEVGDYIALNEWTGEMHTGRCMLMEIEYILDDPHYCPPGMVILGIVPCGIFIDRAYVNHGEMSGVQVYGGNLT